MKAEFAQMRDHWHSMYPEERFGYLGRHINFAQETDFNDIVKWDIPEVEAKLDSLLAEYAERLPGAKQSPYVDEARIEEIAAIQSKKYSCVKLIQLLRELNVAYEGNSFYAIGVILRAIIDHVPPLFGVTTFPEVANNYKGPASFKKAMKKLDDALRNLADAYLHVQIRRAESLPNFTQVDFRSELDILLAEVSRLLQEV